MLFKFLESPKSPIAQKRVTPSWCMTYGKLNKCAGFVCVAVTEEDAPEWETR